MFYQGNNSLFGKYTPLNKSGLVIGNPHGYDHQAYAWLVLPNYNVIGFAGDVLNENGQVVYAPAQSPSIKISINGLTTKVEKELGVAQIE
ncbi:MAG: glycoside hydrolase family 68 protein [Bacillus sp. (in: firmicutes)]